MGSQEPRALVDPRHRLLMTAAAAALFAAAIAVLATIAGWDGVTDRFRAASPVWLALVLGATVVGFLAYVYAFHGVARVEHGPEIDLGDAAVLVAVGFGAFLAKGGDALDERALDPGEGSGREGTVRVLALDALEHAPLAPAAWASALALLAHGDRKPGLDFTIPWATLVPIGTVAAILLVRRRDRFVGGDGWRGRLGKGLDGIHVLFQLLRDWRTYWRAFAGATIYWACDVAALWGATRIFYDRPSVPGVILAHAVGYVLTRRTLPLAGAGVVELLMPLTLAAAGVPFSAAIAGTVVYRIFNLWLPLAPARAAVPAARRILQRTEPAPSRA